VDKLSVRKLIYLLTQYCVVNCIACTKVPLLVKVVNTSDIWISSSGCEISAEKNVNSIETKSPPRSHTKCCNVTTFHCFECFGLRTD
jgi:hypothetical protein